MRLGPGDEIVLFDGHGHEWRARLTAATKAGVRAALIEPLESAREPRVSLTLAQAVLKGEHMDAVIRDATMMGVAAIRPMITERTIARVKASPGASSGARALERWRRVALASAKQCRRATLPAIAPPTSLDALTQRGAGERHQPRIVLAEPSTGLTSPSGVDVPVPASALLAVGPEGGWSAAELTTLLDAGFVALTFGSLTLRADAAALVAIGILRSTWRDL
jgi:16S rRNA (uracil1498-N3)-methyltransferase